MTVTRKCRQTGLPVTVGHGRDLGLDFTNDGPWYVICDDHGTLCSHTTLALARYFAASPLDWCEECMAKEAAK